ncbi:MAG: hypothetical protein HYZ24_04300 [Chloroflexi bacterium]|nr:hypothetical protein [Chloroflexota bacterium]
MAGLIDYAGLFPPASLNLADALDEYSRHLSCADNWMLGRFIIPAAQLANLPTLPDSWHFSVLGRSGATVPEFDRALDLDISCLTAFRKIQRAGTDVFEVRLPAPAFSSANDLSALLNSTNRKLADENNLIVFHEIALDDAWRRNLETTISAISQHNGQSGHRIGFKLRCGGVVAAAFPTVEQIAQALILCRDYSVPLKVTAGLHHPIRHYNESVRTKMHGFINVFGAGILSQAHHLSLEQTVEILNEEDPLNFGFTESHFAWKNLSADSAQIESIRNSGVTSYGCCSFDDPRNDMKKLGWM